MNYQINFNINKTPIEHVNMNNYIMLCQYNKNHDLFLQSGDMMNYVEEKNNNQI